MSPQGDGLNGQRHHHHHTLRLLPVAVIHCAALFTILSSLALLFEAIYLASLANAMRNRRISRKFNLVVLNKALADCLFCLCFLLIGIWKIATKSHQLSDDVLVLDFLRQISESLLVVSLCSYTAYSLLRCYGIRWPFRFRKKFMVHHAIRMNLFSWALFLAFMFISFFLHHFHSNPPMPFTRILLPFLVDLIKCCILVILHFAVIFALSINVVLVYRNWRSARAFHNASSRRASYIAATAHHHCPSSNGPIEAAAANGITGTSANGKSAPFTSSLPPSTLPIQQQPLDRTPSIVNRRHRHSLGKTALNLVAICTLHIPFLFFLLLLQWGMRKLPSPVPTTNHNRQQQQEREQFSLWTLAIGGILLRIAVDALLGTFCDIEVHKSFRQILDHLWPKCLRPSSPFLSTNSGGGSSLTVAYAGHNDILRRL